MLTEGEMAGFLEDVGKCGMHSPSILINKTYFCTTLQKVEIYENEDAQ